jgi:RNA polymerase sigma factor (sigma-70 family)
VSDTPPPFQRFLDEHRDTVWRFLVSSVGPGEAEDCFQETFIAALRAYPRLRSDSNLGGWVMTIAHNKALDCHRSRMRRPLPLAEPERARAGGVRPAPSDERVLAPANGRDDGLWEAVGELPERQRSAVMLRYVGDLPHREIAAAIGCSEEAARRSLHEGLKKLRKVVAA